MANPVVGKNGTHQSREVYINEIVPLMRQQFVVRDTFSRDYERNPKTGQLQVPVRDMDVRVTEYDIKNGTDLSQSATSYLPVAITEHAAINELIDGYEAEAVPDNLKVQRIESGAYSVGLKMENHAIEVLVKQGKIKQDEAVKLTTKNVYADIVNSIKIVKHKGVLKSRMYVVVSDDVEELLLTDEKFANSGSTLGAELIREGVIGKVAGVKTKTSSLLPEGVDYIVYAVDWCQAIDEWAVDPTINNLADGKHIGASALQGRNDFTDVVTNANAVLVKTNSAYIPEGNTTGDTEGDTTGNP